MPNINLIAARREEKKKLERITRQLFFGMAASVGLFILLATYLGAERLKLDSDLADAQEKMQKLQPTLDRISEIQKQTASLKPKVDQLEKAKTETMRWRALFTVVSQSIPDQAWVQTLSSTGGDAGVITLTGVASSQSIVGDTMTRLGSHPLFDHIDLDHTQATATNVDGTVRQVGFQIAAHLRPPAPAAPPAGAAPAGTKTASAEKGGGATDGSAS